MKSTPQTAPYAGFGRAPVGSPGCRRPASEATGDGATPTERPTAPASRRSRRRCDGGLDSAATASSCRCRWRRSSSRPRACARPTRSMGSSAPSRMSGPATRWGGRTATWSAAFAGASTARPTWSPGPRDEDDVRRVLEVCAARRLAAIPYGGGHQRRRRGRATGRARLPRHRLARPDRPERADRDRRGLALGADPGPGRSAPSSRTHSARTGSRSATSRSRSSSRRSAAGSRRAPAATTRRCTTHIDDLVESIRAITPSGDLGDPPPSRLRRRPEPRPPAARLRGHPRRHHRGVDAGPAATALPRVGERCSSTTSAPAAEARARARAVGPPPVELPAARRARGATTGAAATARQRVLLLGFESRRSPARPLMERAVELLRAITAARPGGERRGGARARRRGRVVAERRSSTRRTCGRLVALGVISDTFETAITWDRFDEFHARVGRGARRAVAEASARARRRARRGHLPLHPRLSRRAGAVLHGARARRAGARARAVGRDQGRGVGGDRRRRAARSRTTTPSAATTGPGTTAAARAVRRGARRGQARRSTPRASSIPAC